MPQSKGIKYPSANLTYIEAEYETALHEAMQNGEDILQIHFRGQEIRDTKKAGFQNCLFENCRFTHAQMEECSFINCLFQDCEISNTNWRKPFMQRCAFIRCKGNGMTIEKGVLRDLSLKNCLLRYATWMDCKWQNLEMLDCDFRELSMDQNTGKNWAMRSCNLEGAIFSATSLKSVDLRSDLLSGIRFSYGYPELKGAIVTPVQAVQLANLMEIIIKEEDV